MIEKLGTWQSHLMITALTIFLFLLYHMACRILVPWPGIEPGPLAVKVGNPNRWATRDFWLTPFLRLPFCLW